MFRVERHAGSLAGVPPECLIAYEASPSLGALACDLAIRLAGRTALPVVGGFSTARETVEHHSEPVHWLEEAGAMPGTSDVGWEGRSLPGGCLVAGQQGADLAMIDGAELARAVDRMPGRQEARIRPVLIHHRPLDQYGERVVIEWALREEAAIVLVPASEDLAGAAYWTRPTVLHGSASLLAGLAEQLRSVSSGERGMRSLRKRFRRLRHVFVDGSEMEPEIVRFYETLGARVSALPERTEDQGL